MNKKEKILLFTGVFVLLIISVVGSIVFFEMSGNGTSKKDKFDTQTEENLNNSLDESIENNADLTDEEKEELKNKPLDDKGASVLGQGYTQYQNGIKIGASKNKEYPKEKTEELYNKLIFMAQTADYLNMSKVIEDELGKYKFHEEYNWKIGAVYYDATIMLGVLTVPIEGQGEMVKNMRDPVMMTIGTLMLPEKSRRDVILNEESLSPIFEGKVQINSTEDVTNQNNKYVNEVYDNTGSIKTVLKINFSLEGTPLSAYVPIDGQGKPSLYKIVADDGVKHPYRTISYWKGIMP